MAGSGAPSLSVAALIAIPTVDTLSLWIDFLCFFLRMGVGALNSSFSSQGWYHQGSFLLRPLSLACRTRWLVLDGGVAVILTAPKAMRILTLDCFRESEPKEICVH